MSKVDLDNLERYFMVQSSWLAHEVVAAVRELRASRKLAEIAGLAAPLGHTTDWATKDCVLSCMRCAVDAYDAAVKP